jgi:ATP-dependent helicase/nuclease subunit A
VNPIEFISAGAGSGKTYRLTTILAETLSAGAARSSGVAAMTFTLKAAAELRQRARKELLKRGRLDLSTAVGQARIGTVNAVCSQLLRRFCFDLGLSPEQTVLSEAQSEQMLRRALDDVLDSQQREALVRHGDRLSLEEKDWYKPVRYIVDAARANGIDAATVQAMGPANATAMLSNWPAPHANGAELTGRLIRALEVANAAIIAHIDGLLAVGKAPPQVTTKGLVELQSCRERFAKRTWTWRDWAALGKLDAGAKVRADVQPVLEAAAAHERHPEFHEEVRQYLSLVFELSSRTLSSYEDTKVAAGAQDFIDQEMLLLKALHESDAVRSSLAEELDLVLVDEFQDTSPIQLAVFVELAKLAKRSVWVGDPKQAIYGFRGTDASLIASVVDAVPAWGGSFGKPLTSSRRSVPSLVRLVNQVFAPAFPLLKPEAVQLAPVRAEQAAQPSLFTWDFDSNGAKGALQGLGNAITQLLASGLQVQDARTEVWRPVTPGDIAVLCRKNDDIPAVAASLHRWGIPCVSTRPGLLGTPEAMLVVACLRRMQDPTDTAATALIVSLTDSVPAEDWLDDRLRHVASGAAPAAWRVEGPRAHPLVARLETLRGRLAALTPFEALSLAKAESGVWRASAHWSSSPKEAATRAANVEALCRMAGTYEDECHASKRPATVSGLLQWLAAQSASKLDARAPATSGAVTVSTHHSAKGLEWHVVVLTGLEKPARTGLWDVRSRTDGVFDAQEPLRNRFIHYWPRPYGVRRVPDAMKRAEASPLGLEMHAQALDEHVRLLYVSFTRARDAMVLTLHRRGSPTAWTDEVNASKLLFSGTGDIDLADGSKVRRIQQGFSPQDISAVPPQTTPTERRWFPAEPPRQVEPLWLRPSAATAGSYRVKGVESIGARIPLKTKVDMTVLGSAIHNCIAFCLSSEANATAESVAAILERWRVGAAAEADAVAAQARALIGWVASKWPGGQLHVESPVEVMLKSGRVVRGQIDLLVDVSDGWVLIDHKADPRIVGADHRVAEAHGPQLDAYAQAVTHATARPVLEQWLFLPVAGQAAQIENGAAG